MKPKKIANYLWGKQWLRTPSIAAAIIMMLCVISYKLPMVNPY
jgi:hypothetical protein